MIKAIYSLGLRKNKLLSITLIALSFSIFYFCIFLLPAIIFPKGRMLDVYRKEIYGDLVVYIETDSYGALTAHNIRDKEIYRGELVSFFFKDDAILNEIKSLSFISASMKRKTGEAKVFGKYLYLIDESKKQIQLSLISRLAGIDFSSAVDFYKDNKYVIYPLDKMKEKGVIIRDKDLTTLSDKGITLKEGDLLLINNPNTSSSVIRDYIGTVKSVYSSDSFEAPEAKGYFGVLVDNEAMSEISQYTVKYKSYAEPPTTLKEVAYPGINDTSFDSIVTVDIGYDHILLRLKNGVSEKKAIKQIEKILSKYNSSNKPYRYKVASSYIDVFYDSEIHIMEEEAYNNKMASAVLILALFIIGTISTVVFVKEQASLLNIMYRLGRSIYSLFFDTIKQIFILIGLPGFIGGIVSIAKLESYYGEGIFYYPEIIKSSLLFFVIVFSLFLLMSSLFIYHYIKKGDWESVT